MFLHLRREGLAQAFEADDHVGNHLRFAVRADADCRYPRQELGITGNIGNQIEHLLRRVRQPPRFGMAWH
jgi:hypothetical protein